MKRIPLFVFFLCLILSCCLSACDILDKNKENQASREGANQKKENREDIDPVIATVSGEEIRLSFIEKTYNTWLYQYEKDFGDGAAEIDYYGKTYGDVIKVNLLDTRIKGIAIEKYYIDKGEQISEEELELMYDEMVEIMKEKQPDMLDFYKKNQIDKGFIITGLKTNYYISKLYEDTDVHFREEYQVDEENYKSTKLNISPQVILLEDMETADKVYSKIKSGKDFASLAEKYSLDEPSALRGGELGVTKFEEMPIEFSIEAFKLKKDEVSRPFKTIFGYNIVKILDYETVQDMLDDENSTEIQEAQIKELLYKRALDVQVYKKETAIVLEQKPKILDEFYANIVIE